MEAHLETGRLGEEIACRLLESKGYIILERNWRYKHLEVDIIAQAGGEIIFVEVKTRGHASWSRAMQAVDRLKQQHLITAANHYIRYHRLPHSVRYDIIGIDLLPDGSYQTEHAERAFYPSLRAHRPSKGKARGRQN